MSKEDDDILLGEESIIPIVIGCALCIDNTARSPFVDPQARE